MSVSVFMLEAVQCFACATPTIRLGFHSSWSSLSSTPGTFDWPAAQERTKAANHDHRRRDLLVCSTLIIIIIFQQQSFSLSLPASNSLEFVSVCLSMSRDLPLELGTSGQSLDWLELASRPGG